MKGGFCGENLQAKDIELPRPKRLDFDLMMQAFRGIQMSFINQQSLGVVEIFDAKQLGWADEETTNNIIKCHQLVEA